MEPEEKWDEPQERKEVEEKRPSKRPVWMRGLFMLLLMMAFWVAQWLLWVVAIIQFLWMFFADESNAFLKRFGHSLGTWLGETAQFVSCASEEKPFPWKAWPSAPSE